MRASVIQLKQLFFRRIEVEACEPAEGETRGEAAEFHFEGTTFRVSLDVGSAPTEDASAPQNFVVALGIAIDPAEGNPAPYKIDVSALGLIEVSDQVAPEKRRDLALVNGASLVYGAIRELVATLTSRCVAGTLVLPTADFRDHSEWLVPSTAANTTTRSSPSSAAISPSEN